MKVVGGGGGREWWRRSQKKWSGRGEGGLGWGRSGWGRSGVGLVRMGAVQGGASSRSAGPTFRAFFSFPDLYFFIFLKRFRVFFVDLCQWFGRFDFQKNVQNTHLGSLDIL